MSTIFFQWKPQNSARARISRGAIVLYLPRVGRPSNLGLSDVLTASRGSSSRIFYVNHRHRRRSEGYYATSANGGGPNNFLTRDFPREFPVRFRAESPRRLHSLRIVCQAVYLLVIRYAVLFGPRLPNDIIPSIPSHSRTFSPSLSDSLCDKQ